MTELLQADKYGTINKTYKTTICYYEIKFISEPCIIQEETMCDGKICANGEVFVKAQYRNCMQYNTKWYWGKISQQNNIIVSTRTIVHPCLDITDSIEVKKYQKDLQ